MLLSVFHSQLFFAALTYTAIAFIVWDIIRYVEGNTEYINKRPMFYKLLKSFRFVFCYLITWLLISKVVISTCDFSSFCLRTLAKLYILEKCMILFFTFHKTGSDDECDKTSCYKFALVIITILEITFVICSYMFK